MKKFLVIILTLITLLSLVACGGKNNDTPNGGNSSPEQGDSGSNAEGNSNDSYQFDIKEDDHTVIITIGNTIQIYTHDGVNVTGYATYVDCGDVETAKVVASAINPSDSYYADMGLKSVTTKGKYVVQEYNEKGFPCKTYEELHNLAEMYEQIQ